MVETTAVMRRQYCYKRHGAVIVYPDLQGGSTMYSADDLERAIVDERKRCLACVEVHYEYAKSLPGGDKLFGAHGLLFRIANMIRSGNEDPLPFGPDQMMS